MADHIERRRQGWYAILRVPANVRQRMGRKRFRVSLNTKDRATALRRAPMVVADWQGQIDRARGDPEARDDEVFHMRQMLKNAKTDDEKEWADERLRDFMMHHHYDHTDHGEVAPETNAIFSAITAVGTFDAVDAWLASLTNQITPKTASMRRQTLKRLSRRLPALSDITRPAVFKWVEELRVDLQHPTVQRMLTDCRRYWHHLEKRGIVNGLATPFDRQLERDTNTQRRRIEWEPAELIVLLRAAQDKAHPLADLILLAMYSGARLGELMALKVSDVKGDHFTITEAKTAAGVRSVPIHPAVQQTIELLVEESKDDYLLPGGPEVMSKRFRRLRIEQGFTDPRQVFHSIRATFVTMMERAGVPEHITQDIVGHARSTLTGRTYSGKSLAGAKALEIRKVVYPTPSPHAGPGEP